MLSSLEQPLFSTVYQLSFQFFPSCCVAPPKPEYTVKHYVTFNSFPVASGGLVLDFMNSTVPFNSFPVASQHIYDMTSKLPDQWTFNSFPVASYL
ncbi:MAG: hypothetical protein N3E41_08430 [Thermofilaceae archaeon]|nr:hypothetical protein [Thermofilaceae archaeon]